MFKKIWNFVIECKVELKEKTNWPSKDEVLNSTVVTVSSIFFVSLSLYFIDLGSSFVVRFVVVEKVSMLKEYVNNFTFVPFVILFFLVIILYSRIKARLNR